LYRRGHFYSYYSDNIDIYYKLLNFNITIKCCQVISFLIILYNVSNKRIKAEEAIELIGQAEAKISVLQVSL